MGVGSSSLSHSLSSSACTYLASFSHRSESKPVSTSSSNILSNSFIRSTKAMQTSSSPSHSSLCQPLRCQKSVDTETKLEDTSNTSVAGSLERPPELIKEMVSEALFWCSLHGLVVGDRNNKRSATVPGVGLIHAPLSLLPTSFPEGHWKQACEVIRLGLHRSDYMLDAQTKELLQIELNTISCSFPGLGSLVTALHRNLLSNHGKDLGLDSKKVPENAATSGFAEALAKAWNEYNDSSAVIMVVVSPEEYNMYDQHWLCEELKQRHSVTTIRRTLADINREGEILPSGALQVGNHTVAVVYFRAGYSPNDYPSENEWSARLMMEQSSAIKCPSISYHLVGTKKIQQELAKPNILERFLDNQDDIAKLRKCFAGLWGLDDSDVIKEALERPDLFVLKPQREGGGNNIYGDNVRDTLLKLQLQGTEGLAAYILMQRIFPTTTRAFMVRDGVCYQDTAISELGIYGAYLRNKDKVIMNDQCGYLMRTKVSSSNEGGVAAGFAVLDSIYLI
ncbi:glutathione synthetase, chloroplastic isoform X2 [Aristolochia californica]|uniref:glutathione synthetase, chloroplastic isoform X2 n=1 Tax=Aristolochia californica TaxID=171875 RepID=UPI0035D59BEF